MKPAWDKLMQAFEGSTSALIADVDCTAAGKDLCETHGVQGFPTIKYGDPNNLEDYEGGRDYDELKAFADANLGPRCGPENKDLCDDASLAVLDEALAMSGDALQTLIDEKNQEIKDAESAFETLVEGLQKQYTDAEAAKDEKIKSIKTKEFGIQRSVLAFKNRAEGGSGAEL